MFKARSVSLHHMLETQGWNFKIYQILAEGKSIDWSIYDEGIRSLVPQLMDRTAMQGSHRVGFVICHEGSSMSYLVACAWGNDNELFVEVRVHLKGQWCASQEYSFCLYDMEVMWFERNAYLMSLYSGNPDRERYLQLSHVVTI